MKKQKISKKEIIRYYDTTEFDYKFIWDLNNSHAMHYGYWDNTVKNFPQALQRENEILAEKAKIKQSDVILDAGCGVGGSSIFLTKQFSCKTIGITLSKKQTETAKRNALKCGIANNTKFLVMDFENLTFSKNTFDVVWAIESICHADSKKKFIQEAYRVLKKGGRIIVADAFLMKDFYTKEEETILQKFLYGWGVNFLESRNNFKTFLQEAGFQNISFTNITKNVTPSAKRMYYYSIPGIIISKTAEFLKLRSKVQTNGVISAYYQYKAVTHKLVTYEIFYAEKS